MNISMKSITGNYRELNEDRIGVFKNKTDQMLLLVADGMGGHEKGEVAAQFVIDKIEDIWINSNFFNEQELEPFLRDLVIKSNRALYLYSNEETKEHNMGTTLAMAVITDESIYVLNIGDSRVYALQKREILQVTKDHTFVNMLVESGEITQEEAFVHPQRNIVTKALGTTRLVQPDVFKLRNRQYDYLLLASDGLTDKMNEETLHNIVYKGNDMDRITEDLVNEAVSLKSKDNISVILAQLKDGRT